MIAMVERRQTEQQIPPDVLLAGPTIEHLADHIRNQTGQRQEALVEIHKGGTQTPFHFLHGDYESGGFYSQKIAQGLGPDRPFYALSPCGRNGHPAPETYQKMAKIHLDAVRGASHKGRTCWVARAMVGSWRSDGATALRKASKSHCSF